MLLVFHLSTDPPPKSDWHHPDPNKRAIWNKVSEAITTWFCLSNGLRKEHNVLLEFEEFSIKLEGESIRYLAPSLRSAISLIFKAYTKAISTNKRYIESSPGITIHPPTNLTELPRPWYNFSYQSDRVMSKQIRDGTIFANWMDKTIIPIEVPTGDMISGIIWFHYSINGELHE